jgi:hypothetical protein
MDSMLVSQSILLSGCVRNYERFGMYLHNLLTPTAVLVRESEGVGHRYDL